MSILKKNKGEENISGLIDRQHIVNKIHNKEEVYHRYKNKVKEQLFYNMSVDEYLNDDEFMDLIKDIIEEEKDSFIDLEYDKDILAKKIFQSIRQNDVIQDLLDDDTITEVMINGYNTVFIERNGKIEKSAISFESSLRLQDVIQKMVSKVNRVVNEASPIVDARLLDGSRINVVLPPVAIDGPIVTIRKFPKESITMDRLVEFGSITHEVKLFLEQLIKAKYNIFISGGTGSGKTTFLNALSDFIPKDERIITIEDSAELQIKNIPNIVRLEVRNPNVEGKQAICIRDLIKAALRMRPSRIIVGEVRDSAAIDLLDAYNTGHDGSLSTGHANSAYDMLGRLESMVLMGMDIPVNVIRRKIASAIDIVIHLGRLRDNSRSVLEISEVVGIDNNDCIVLNKLFEYIEEEVVIDGMSHSKRIGTLVRNKNEMINIEKLIRAGIKV